MLVLGIDVGFSAKRATSCYCALKIIDAEITFAIEPTKFGADFDLQVLVKNQDYHVITIDAPVTPKPIHLVPKSGRKIEKLFSKGRFSNSKRGPQPSSIAVPRQGWSLYQAGMNTVSRLHPYRYLSITDIKAGLRKGIYEVLPKMTQSLLLPREVVSQRVGQIDDFLFPRLFSKNGPYRHLLNHILGDYRFSEELELYIEQISNSPKKYHEELASIVCAFQAMLIAVGKAAVVGFVGDHEGYYALPDKVYWNDEWKSGFDELVSNKAYEDLIFVKV